MRKLVSGMTMLAVLCTCLAALASMDEQGPARLVKDINTSTNPSDPGNLTDVGGTLFFSATEPTIGIELWRSDGTADGTVLVKEIGNSFPHNLTAVGGMLFFTAYVLGIEREGRELWKSDGTDEGTLLVKDINPGIGDSNPSFLTAVGGTLFFRAFEPTTGRELWKSDGTDEGTVLVKDIYPGSGDSTLFP